MDSLLKSFVIFMSPPFNRNPHMSYKLLLGIEVPMLPLLYVLTCTHTYTPLFLPSVLTQYEGIKH